MKLFDKVTILLAQALVLVAGIVVILNFDELQTIVVFFWCFCAGTLSLASIAVCLMYISQRNRIDNDELRKDGIL